ncbi:AAA family ATPase [Thalassotalea fusca]
MYTGYFGLKEAPFTIAPNPAYLFMSDRHREALAHLTYGLGDTGGFVLLTGEVGTGKTTICRTVMEQLPDNTQAAFILNPTLSCEELLATLCDELKIRYKKTGASIKYFTDKIHQQLLDNHEKGINTLLVIDEAQHLQAEVLEQLRLLTNLETNTKKLLQVILIGQPELQQLLQRRDLRQLAQRITARYHLMPLTLAEVEQYIKHRLSVAECVRPLFNRGAVKQIHRISKGIPRVMNLLCERSLINAFNSNDTVVNAAIVKRSAIDALGPEAEVKSVWVSTPFKLMYTSVAIVASVGLGYFVGFERQATDMNTFDSAKQHLVSPPSNHLIPADRNEMYQAHASLQSPTLQTPIMQTPPAQVSSSSDDAMQSSPRDGSFAQSQDETKRSTEFSTDKIAVQETPTKAINVETAVEEESVLASQQETSEPNEEDFKVLGYQPEKYQQAQSRKVFTVEQGEGVSDELLARFQSAITATEQEVSSDILSSEQSTDELYSEIMPLHEMPEAFKDALPEISFEMHIYATDGKGWVRVNGEDRYQGDEIIGGVEITEILPQRVVLSFNGEKFSMPALSSW